MHYSVACFAAFFFVLFSKKVRNEVKAEEKDTGEAI